MPEEISAGDLIVFLTYLKNAFRPIRDFAKNSSRIAKATAAGERVADLLDARSDVCDRDDARAAPAFTGHIRYEQVRFGYVGRAPVLDRLDLDIRPGETVALIGESGVGKSTLSSLLMRLYDPTGGRVLIDGHDLRDLTLASLRSQISVVLQESLLFSDSVRENIALARPEASDGEIEAAARLANAHDFIMALPDGYATILTERGTSLSAGQRQRLAIARAALRQTPILILDEPTVSLDRENERTVIEALGKLSRGRTVLLVTHDLSFAAQADRIVVLDSGRIVESGDHAALLARGGRYARLVQSAHAAAPVGQGSAYAREELVRKDVFHHRRSRGKVDNLVLRAEYELTRDWDLAAYVLKQEDRLASNLSPTFVGLQSRGKITPRLGHWLELSRQRGTAGTRRLRANAFDAGLIYTLPIRFRPAVFAGYARGSGGGDSRTSREFRQTGLQDNEDRITGLGNVRYYGELLDPDLSNLSVQTVGAGIRPSAGTSLEIVGHRYRQVKANDNDVRGSPVSPELSGDNRSIGTELDAIFAARIGNRFGLEAKVGWFRPGAGFSARSSDAFLAKIRLVKQF